MFESNREMFERLELMAGPEGARDWDFSPNDQAAVGWALARITELEDERDIFKRTLDKRDDRIAELEAELARWRDSDSREFAAVCIRDERIAELEDLVRIMLHEDPYAYAADAITVLDVWRKRARVVLGDE